MTPHPSHAFSLTRCVRCGCPPRSLTARIECVAVIERDAIKLERKCAFRDPYCPCQDGDACHYVDLPCSPAMKPPSLTDIQDWRMEEAWREPEQ